MYERQPSATHLSSGVARPAAPLVSVLIYLSGCYACATQPPTPQLQQCESNLRERLLLWPSGPEAGARA
jgi:hypothetical protein